MKWKTIPFNLEMARRIQDDEIKGKIRTRSGENVRIICWDKKSLFHNTIVALINKDQTEELYFYAESGEHGIDPCPMLDLVLEVPEEAPKQKGELTIGKCKEGDEVWIFSNYDYGPEYVKVKVGKFSIDRSSGRRRNIIFDNGFTCQELTSQICWYENPDEQKIKTKEFKPFDKVLVRDDEFGWIPTLYSFFTHKDTHMTINGEWDECIPYEGNEHLVGTTDKPE